MAKSTSKKISFKASPANPLVKPTPRDKTLFLDPSIHFYKLEDGDETVEGEESEILFLRDSSLAVYKQNIFKSKFPYIKRLIMRNPQYHAMCGLHSGVFDRIETTSPMDAYQGYHLCSASLEDTVLKSTRRFW